MIGQYIRGLSRFQRIKYSVIVVYFILNAFLMILSFQMNIDDLKFLVKMARYIPYFRYIASANILLIIIVLSMYYLEIRKLKKINKNTAQKVDKIKSRLFDLEEDKKSYIRQESEDK